MWYTRRHESSHFYSTIDRGRTAADPGGITFVRCLYVTSLPDSAGLCAPRTGTSYRPPTGLRRPDRAQCDQRLQRHRPGSAPSGFLAPPSAPHHLQRRRVQAVERPVAPQPSRLRLRPGSVDLRVGGQDQFRAGNHPRGDLRRKCAPSAQTLRHQLEACQALDHQPRPAVPPKKNARDRLITWASTQPSWAIGYLDEVWWSRFALPRLHAWQDEDRPVRLVEQSWQQGDPDPKAFACYGVLWQQGPAADPIRKHMSLRFVTGRPVSAITTQFLEWCCTRLQAQGKTSWLLIWDNASWHVSKQVRTWIREHNQQVRQTGKGVRILPFFLPTKSPWLNPIEPKWVHGKRAVVEPDHLLSAQQLAERICSHFGCSYEPHLVIPEKVV